MNAAPSLKFDPLDFFNGHVEATGIVVDFRGRIARSFAGLFVGKRQEQMISIDETLTYNDGVRDERRWLIRSAAPGRWLASANGLVADAVIIQDAACQAQSRWTYQMDVPVNGRPLRMNFQDIMTLIEADRMIALTPMTKFGIKLAHISSEYRRMNF